HTPASHAFPTRRSSDLQTPPPVAAAPTIAPTAVFGSVSVSTSPSDAIVTVDGKRQLSPTTFSQLKPGRYPMRVELSGYETVEQQDRKSTRLELQSRGHL